MRHAAKTDANMKFDLSTSSGRYLARKAGYNIPKRRPGPPQISLDDFIQKGEGCWLWIGKLNTYGYGKFTRFGKTCFAHREMWERHHGKIPSGFVVRHSCDNPACVNPEHLLVGSHADNRRDTVERNRQAKGEAMAAAKLTEARVLEIRARYKFRLVTQKQLAREYGVSLDLIHKVVNRIYWKHI